MSCLEKREGRRRREGRWTALGIYLRRFFIKPDSYWPLPAAAFGHITTRMGAVIGSLRVLGLRTHQHFDGEQGEREGWAGRR